MKKYLIVANGEFPTRPETLELLQEADYIVCCDGAIKSLDLRGITPNYIIGDLDSIEPAMRVKYAEIIHHSADQETNDLTKAFNHCLSVIETTVDTQIYIIAATGYREDHTLGNISLLSDYQLRHPKTEMITDYGIFRAYNNSFTKEEAIGTHISIFAYDPTLTIESQGLQYPTDKVVFDRWWKATLNKTQESCYSLTLSHPSSILVFTNFVNLQP